MRRRRYVVDGCLMILMYVILVFKSGDTRSVVVSGFLCVVGGMCLINVVLVLILDVLVDQSPALTVPESSGLVVVSGFLCVVGIMN